jgi:hypothetical protein
LAIGTSVVALLCNPSSHRSTSSVVLLLNNNNIHKSLFGMSYTETPKWAIDGDLSAVQSIVSTSSICSIIQKGGLTMLHVAADVWIGLDCTLDWGGMDVSID